MIPRLHHQFLALSDGQTSLSTTAEKQKLIGCRYHPSSDMSINLQSSYFNALEFRIGAVKISITFLANQRVISWKFRRESIAFSPLTINHFQSTPLISTLPTRHYHLHLLPTTLRLIRVWKISHSFRLGSSFLRKTASALIQQRQIMEKRRKKY